MLEEALCPYNGKTVRARRGRWPWFPWSLLMESVVLNPFHCLSVGCRMCSDCKRGIW